MHLENQNRIANSADKKMHPSKYLFVNVQKTNHKAFWLFCRRWRVISSLAKVLNSSPSNHYTYLVQKTVGKIFSFNITKSEKQTFLCVQNKVNMPFFIKMNFFATKFQNHIRFDRHIFFSTSMNS